MIGRKLVIASEAMRLFSESPSVLEPILEGSPKQLGIHERFERIGISMPELIANGTPIFPDVIGVPLALSKSEVEDAVRVVHANPVGSRR